MLDAQQERQTHTDAIFDLIGYVLERCPDSFDGEMQGRFDRLIGSFQRAVAVETDDNSPDPSDVINEVHVGRNYLIAHAAILQSFVNATRRIAQDSGHDELKREVEKLDRSVERNFENFFAEPFRSENRNK
jgi:hypothetical protein